MQRIVSAQRRPALDDRGRSRRRASTLKADPDAAGEQGHFRQRPPHRRARDHPRHGADDVKMERGRPVDRRLCWASRRPGSWSNGRCPISAGVIVGREVGRPARRPDPDRPGFRSGGDLGFVPLIHLAAVLSVSIGLLNLFPVPLLDGGHLLFYAIEAMRGRPLSERAQEFGFRVGLALVLMLMVFATYNDILSICPPRSGRLVSRVPYRQLSERKGELGRTLTGRVGCSCRRKPVQAKGCQLGFQSPFGRPLRTTRARCA